jgi:transcriptional regulator with XRE-family HTH domain
LKKGLSQAELAERAGMSRIMISQLETEERKPSRKLIARLCLALGATSVEERELLLAYDFSPSGETPDQIAAFLRSDKNLSEDAADKIANMVREAYSKYSAEKNQSKDQDGE